MKVYKYEHMAEKTRRLEVELEKSWICAEIISEDCDKIAGIVDYLKRPIDEVEEESGPWINQKPGFWYPLPGLICQPCSLQGFCPRKQRQKAMEMNIGL